MESLSQGSARNNTSIMPPNTHALQKSSSDTIAEKCGAETNRTIAEKCGDTKRQARHHRHQTIDKGLRVPSSPLRRRTMTLKPPPNAFIRRSDFSLYFCCIYAWSYVHTRRQIHKHTRMPKPMPVALLLLLPE